MTENISAEKIEVVADAELPTGMVSVRATGEGDFTTLVQTKHYAWVMDEPESVPGGLGLGPNPYEMLQSALASCTLMTVGMYARRKNIELGDTRVSVTHCAQLMPNKERRSRFAVVIEFAESLSFEQRTRLLEIARRCPVHKTLTGTVEVVAEEG
ncbi:OsmC family protein [Rothia sp. ZJ1223]|uniref:OsmC family protein n=1 Tax=Rothia sp. ZJ1223 TaxID=2811098 RepID=UPI00195D0434|nr:OsmC family protein [Rothia sp. ZJ1223]MBM7051340.1 OsmC family protein [Rothia sp. ZJ1223]